MNITSQLNRVRYGVPIKLVNLTFIKRRKDFTEISENLTLYGDAARAVSSMTAEGLYWYLTDTDCLVCSAILDVNINTGTPKNLTVVMDENLEWLSKRTNQIRWDNFGTPIRIKRNELDHYDGVILVEEAHEKVPATI